MSGRPAEDGAVRACREGRMDGLRQLYELYGSQVHRTCYRILGNPALAEEATQEIFLRVFQRIDSFDGRSLFSTWLYRVAVNQTLTLLQKERRQGQPVPAGLHLVGRPLSSAEQSALLQEALQQLTPDARLALTLREIEGLSYKEMAEILDIPMGTVMSRLSRARMDFKKIWNGDGIEQAREASKKKGTN